MDSETVLIGQEQIAQRVDEMVDEMVEKCPRDVLDNLLLVGVLRGSFIFLADLLRSFHRHGIHPHVDFMTLSSYGDGTVSEGKVKILHDLREEVAGRDLLVVDDILDTGRTLFLTRRLFLERSARSVQTCVLLDKKARRAVEMEADYVGFCIPDDFVVGYGLDFANRYRGLPYIARLQNSETARD